MINVFFRLCAGFFLIFVLTGCGSTPTSLSRASTELVSPPKAGITELSRQFQLATPSIVNFAFDVADLDDEARLRLDQQAAWIIAHPKVRFRVYGHTDKVGNVAYNMVLGLRRAGTVVDYLSEKGIDRSRLEAMVSFGEEFPVVETEDRELANRRTLTDVIGFIVPKETVFNGDGGEREQVTSRDGPTEPSGETQGAGGENNAGGSNGGGGA